MPTGVACIGVGSNIEHHIRDTSIRFERDPTSSTALWKWTDMSSLHRAMVPLSVPARYYLHVDVVMLHELGHALGLPDFRSPTTYRGIMR